MLVKTTDRLKRAYRKQKCFLKPAIHIPKQSYEDFQKALKEIQLTVIYAHLRVHEDIWYNACLLQAADTAKKRDFITSRISLNEYREHEKKIYGTINA